MFKRILHAGTGPQFTDRHNRRTLMVNEFSLSISLIGLPYIFIFYFASEPLLGLLVTPVVLVYLLVPLLNHFGYFNLGRAAILIAGNAAVTGFSLACGRDCGISLYFFALMAFPFIAFEYNDVKKIVAGISLPLVLFILVEILSANRPPLVTITQPVQLIIYCSMIFSTGLSIVLAGLYNFIQGAKTITQINEATNNLQIILNNANDIIMTIERGNIYSSINHAGRGDVNRVLGKSIYEMVPPDQARRYAALNDEVFSTGKALQATDFYTMPDGTVVWHKLTLCPVLDEHRKVTRIIGFSRDVTDEKNMLEELTRSKELAEAASVAKSAFLANMSHEIRTPMASVLGYVDVLERNDLLPEKRKTVIEAVRRNGNYLLTLLTEILDLTKIESGQLEIKVAEVDLQEEIHSVVELLRPRAEKKNIVLDVVTMRHLRTIRTDALRIRQILINIIGNAIKFTEKGFVKISISENKNLLQIDVTDTGIGILPEHQSEIFSPFSQADGDIAAKFGGSGLGLAISARLAVALGGRVELTRSGPGSGSCFSVFIDPNLSGNTSSRKQQTLNPPTALNNLRILTVEDNKDVQDLLCDILSYAGASVERAANGKTAIEKIESGGFDMVFMDVQMPEMNGYQATEHLRQKGCKVPIVALTAFASTESNSRCMKAGFNDVLYKPFDKNELIRLALKHSVKT